MSLSDEVESVESLGELDDKILSRALSLVLNPPVKKVDLSESLISSPLLSQQSIEYVELDVLEKSLGKHGSRIFTALDTVVSLLPHSMLSRVKKSEDLNIIRKWIDFITSKVKSLEKVKAEDFMSEDAKKNEVLLVAPSHRQLDPVRGFWDKWVWKRFAYDGSEAPDPERLLGEVLNIARILKSEGVRVTIAFDSVISFDAGDDMNVLKIEIPKGLAKIGYVRDQSVSWFGGSIIGNMALSFRRGEEEVIIEVYHKLGLYPVYRVRWALEGKVLVKAYMEGGNFFVVKTGAGITILTGIGIRGSNWATFKALAKILPEDVRLVGVPLAGYIKEWSVGAVHLDVVLAYLGDVGGERVALVDPSRVGFYALLEYDRFRDSFKPVEFLKLMRDLGVKVDEPPRKGQSLITMVNALNLGNGKLVADSYNEDANKYIESTYGVDVIRVSIPQLEAGGGGVRCSTRELWRSLS